ncbi:MAG: hypothetical protein ACI4VH_01980 [Clostridia bacterium]
MEKIFKNLLSAIGVMLYFIVLNFAYTRMDLQRLVQDIEVFAGAFLVLGIWLLEKAYKADKGEIALNGIELLALSLHSLSIMHVITLFKYDFRLYLLTSSYIISIYYVFKSIVIYTKDRKEYLKGLSDISEIVKEEEPVKKEAKKRKTRFEEQKEKDGEDLKPKKVQENSKIKKADKDNSESKTNKTIKTKKTKTTKAKTTSSNKNKGVSEETAETIKKTSSKANNSSGKTKSKKESQKQTVKEDIKTKTDEKPTQKTTTKKKTTKPKKEVKEND